MKFQKWRSRPRAWSPGMWSDTQRIQTQLLSFLGIFAPFICFHLWPFTIYCKMTRVVSDDGHCPYLHSWKIDSPETVDPIYQHWVPTVADWSIRPLYRGWYLLWLTIIDNGWQCNAFAGHLCRSFGSEKILELWVKMESFFKRAMLPFFCCNSATINAWSKSKCLACFIFVVTWLSTSYADSRDNWDVLESLDFTV